MSRPIKHSPHRQPSDQSSRSIGTSYRSQFGERGSIAAIAEESIARDLEEAEEDGELEDDVESGLDRAISHQFQHSMASFRRPSYIAGAPRPFLGAQAPESVGPMDRERETAINEERSLLRDNNLIPPKHPRRRDSQASLDGNGLKKRFSFPSLGRTKSKQRGEEEEEATERTTLLGNGAAPPGRDPEAPYGGEDDPETIDKKWEEAVMNGQIQTTWQRETKVLARYSGPLMLTFVLQNSLTLASIFTVGHIGKVELGAVSLGGMTANITGYAVYHGLATSLDTLCAQAYGSGKKQLVGLQLQRMVFFLWAITIPIAIVWSFGTQILGLIVPEKEIAVLAGRYLKVLILGAPGYSCFESGKRYVQAQGKFAATMYVLLIAAPLNVFMHWLFVWVSLESPCVCPSVTDVLATEIPMGLHRLPYRRCHHREPYATDALRVRPLPKR